MIIFKASGIVKRFTGHLALDNVSVSVPEGSVYGLLGPNGAGKTTLLRIINMITAPDSGEMFFKGRPVKSEDIHQIGYLPEERGLYKKMKVGEQALYLARLKGLSKADALKRLKHWFEKFEIQSWWDKTVDELSKGMQQKVQFITTVIHQPPLLIFDEPFSGFDPINTNLIKNEILELKRQGSTIIFSTHDMGSVEELCDHITLINKSRIILEGEINQIRQSYKSNVFEIGFKANPEGLLSATDGMAEVTQSYGNGQAHFLKLKLKAGYNGNDILKSFLSRTEIIAFNEVIPGMNEIFIKVVQSQPNSQQASHEQ